MNAPAPVEIGFSLGGNLGDRLACLRAARDALAATPGARLAAQSPVYETEPVGVKPEHRNRWYLNAVVILTGAPDPEFWLRRAAEIEAALGRVRGDDRYAPRTIDIDLLFCGAARSARAGLTVPHPRWAQRRFVLRPLADLRPDLRLPGTAATIREQLAALPPGETVTHLAGAW